MGSMLLDIFQVGEMHFRYNIATGHSKIEAEAKVGCICIIEGVLDGRLDIQLFNHSVVSMGL